MSGSCGIYCCHERRIEVFVEKHEGKRILGRHGHRWENGIKTDLKGVVSGTDRFDLAQNRHRRRLM